MDRLSSALREVEAALLVTKDDPAEAKRLQGKYIRIFAALEARRNNDELSDEELEEWAGNVYEQNEIID